MLPLSLGRRSPGAHGSRHRHGSFAWLHPANIATATSAETRALITWLGFFVICGVAIAFGHVWLRLKVTDAGYRRLDTGQIIRRLEMEGRDLTAKIARLDAPERLEEAARTRLGLMRPQRGQEATLP